ncbi:MAG: porin, partial [Burkholderiales bacterium]|nr:porin [Burkholderiales bacterium]
DTPYKISSLRLDAFNGTTIAYYTGIVGGNSTTTTANVANRFLFDRRQSNSVQYWSPSIAGLTVRAAYGANEERATGGNASLNPWMGSVSIAWDSGPFYVGGAYEQHKEYGGVDSAKDWAAKVFASFKFGTVTLGLMGERLKYQGFSAATTSHKGTINASTSPLSSGLEITDYYASLGWQFGPNNLAFTYGADQKVEINGSENSNAKARQFSVRYAYDLSKRTQFYAMATKIDNKSNSANVFGINPIVTPGAAGQDPQGVGVGFRHVF